MVKDIYLFGKWMPLAKVFLSSVVSKAKVALCSDTTVHCHRADLLIDILCGWAVGSARRGGAGGTAYRFRGESLGIKKVLHSDRFYALLLLESLVQFPKLLSEKAEINDRKTLEKAIIAHYGNTGCGVFKRGVQN